MPDGPVSCSCLQRLTAIVFGAVVLLRRAVFTPAAFFLVTGVCRHRRLGRHVAHAGDISVLVCFGLGWDADFVAGWVVFGVLSSG